MPNAHTGFTLIELTVVMALLAILATGLLGNFLGSLKKGRDARRKEDLDGIAKGLSLYYNDHNAFPTTAPSDPRFPWKGTFAVTVNGKTVTYMQSVPNDPMEGRTYDYATDASGTYFRLFACLENDQDPKRIVPVGSPNCKACNNSCNYGIASQNATACSDVSCPTPAP